MFSFPLPSLLSYAHALQSLFAFSREYKFLALMPSKNGDSGEPTSKRSRKEPSAEEVDAHADEEVDEEDIDDVEEDDSLTLDEREQKWGFSLEELKSATKVIQRLFTDPSLFISDPYLEESRLYTMISRDRGKKRQFQDVYKTIMKQEKKRRVKYQRKQDLDAVRRTVMKREREMAFSSLRITEDTAGPRLLLCDNTSGGGGSPTTQVEATATAVVPAGDPSGPVVAEVELTDQEKQVLRLIGAFEALLRLERAYEGEALLSDEEKAALQVTLRLPDPIPPSSEDKDSERIFAKYTPAVNWAAVTQLNAQYYRYVPHLFNTAMPPPIFRNRAGCHTFSAEERQRQPTVDVALVALARQVEAAAQLPPTAAVALHAEAPGARVELSRLTQLDEDFVLHHVEPLFRTESGLRRWVAGGAVPASAHADHVRTMRDVVRAAEVVLLEGGVDERFALLQDGGAVHPCAAAVARQALRVAIARRLYQFPRLQACGPSPFNVEYAPPTSDAQEPDVYCAYDDVQLYAFDHHEDASLIVSRWRSCHICCVRYNHLHPYYYSLCHLCGEFNYNKRLIARDLRGKVVLLTGCRIKIGYAMAVSLLRSGAVLLGTTRFAHEAVARFQEEPDYADWRERLHLFALDLRDMFVVTQFCAFVTQHYPKLFAIINNAAQTIQRTPAYTEHLRHIEMHPPEGLQKTIAADPTSAEWQNFFLHHTSVTIGQPLSIEHAPQQPFLSDEGPSAEAEVATEGEATSQRAAAAAVAVRPSPCVETFDRYDTHAEESDHRTSNSWVMKLAEVQGSEAAEVMAINALSPFILNSKLKPCLENREGDEYPNEARFIINVSAMEGQFYRFKQTTHPHTNMAKAALNMMTRTSGLDYANAGIFMNSVDTGWITDESPKERKERRAAQEQLCPLDEVDAAARCLDLIYTNSLCYGKFYKDFKEILW
ncbi:oxidoreductase-like protein [Strigomonas culicis]|uniref:Oxidoreductase-like protein n=1 Tax=Strigomonas culicis TaxID=28005 RepID=S9UD55_9TRYP|nr:oxidoreductase-like protein [Strigomonas culicis]|eukprot:EPY26639.1 oxidoreductase-like protein [Strigomonas culicis]